MLTLKEFTNLPAGKVFAKGEIIDDVTGVNFTNSGRMLKWVAKKGYANDWAVYAHLSECSYSFVESNGDKLGFRDNILTVVPCEDTVFKKYRY